jgi:hypothetical protein
LFDRPKPTAGCSASGEKRRRSNNFNKKSFDVYEFSSSFILKVSKFWFILNYYYGFFVLWLLFSLSYNVVV